MGNRGRHALTVVCAFGLAFALFFAPVWWPGRLLAPGDGFLYHLPAFLWGVDLWNPYLFAGFPQFADAQAMLWYPARILVKALGLSATASFNLFVMLAYVLAAVFTYGYLLRITGSKFAAVTAAATFSCSGFMIAHLGHVTIIHSAAWLPLILWSVEQLHGGGGVRWMIVAALGTVCCILAGHMQVALHVIGLSALYALFLNVASGSVMWRPLGLSAVGLCAGVLLAGLQLLPTMELGRLSVRSQLSYDEFVSYSLPLDQDLSLLFPDLYGGDRSPGTRDNTEVNGYVGWLPFVLMLAVVSSRRDTGRRTIFWAAVLVTALILSAGGSMPALSRLTFRIPIYNLFRCPARHLLEFVMASSILASLSMAALAGVPADRRRLWGFAKLSAALVCLVLVALTLIWPAVASDAFARGDPQVPATLWSSPFTGVGLLRCGLTVLAVGCLVACPRSGFALCFIAFATVMDLVAVAYFSGWRTSWYRMPRPDAPHVADSDGRVATLSGPRTRSYRVLPNLSQLYHTASVNGFGPLLLRRYYEASGIDSVGQIDPEVLDDSNRALDLLGVRRVVQNREGLFVQTTGAGRGDLQVEVPGMAADRISLVSHLAFSLSVPSGAAVARLTVARSDGGHEEFAVVAGRDVSEWSYDKADIVSRVRHGRARIFSDFPSPDGDGKVFTGHEYLAVFRRRDARPIASLTLHWTGPARAFLQVSQLTLQDGRGHAWPLTLSRSGRWITSQCADGRLVVQENPRALPTAWLADSVCRLRPVDTLTAIKTSRLPDGRCFDPARMALVETDVEPVGDGSLPGEAHVLEARAGCWHIQTQAPGPRMLVVSESTYPGWTAHVDGQPQPVLTVDYALKGVRVPAGSHDVRLDFIPSSLREGLALTMAGALLLVGTGIVCRRQKGLPVLQ